MIAYHFNREMRYDFVPYSAQEDDPDSPATGYLACERMYGPRDSNHSLEYRVTGGFVFRPHLWTDGFNGPSLTFMWIHPYRRRAGLATACWQALSKLHPGFRPAGPFSPGAMKIMARHGPLPHPSCLLGHLRREGETLGQCLRAIPESARCFLPEAQQQALASAAQAMAALTDPAFIAAQKISCDWRRGS